MCIYHQGTRIYLLQIFQEVLMIINNLVVQRINDEIIFIIHEIKSITTKLGKIINCNYRTGIKGFKIDKTVLKGW